MVSTLNENVTSPRVAPNDQRDGIATPTPSNNPNWFPPPPPTPLHLSLQADEPVDSQPGRYHEHRRSFEMDDSQLLMHMDSADAITLPPLSPPPPPLQENGPMNGGERSSVTSFLLNLPPPPPVADLSIEGASSPPAIPPRDPGTSVTAPSNVSFFDFAAISFFRCCGGISKRMFLFPTPHRAFSIRLSLLSRFLIFFEKLQLLDVFFETC